MRTKLSTLVLALFGSFFVATACGDDGPNNPGNGGAGEAGETGAGGSDGPGAGGSSTAGKGGTPSGMAGEPSSNGGYPSSSGGEAGSGTEAGSGPGVGGGGAGESSSGGAGGEGGGGSVDCTEIDLSAFETIVTSDYSRFLAEPTPNLGGAADDIFVLELMAAPFDGGDTGTFDLTENGDDNFQTCSRCFRVLTDDNKMFFQSEGTLEIDEASMGLEGSLDATITNLKLVEVTIGNNSVSTPVPNGACLTIASATIQAERAEVPVGWDCNESWVGDGDCDCGCGAKDADCVSTTNEAECDYCAACTGDFDLCPDDEVDPADTTACL